MAQDRWSARVQVEVSAPTNDLRDQLVSYITRNLRSLGDVEVVDTNPTFKISIVSLSNTLMSGQSGGYTISTVILKPLDATQVDLMLKSMDTPEVIVNMVSIMTTDEVEFKDHLLNTGSVYQLPAMCQDLVTSLDSRVFENERKQYRGFQDYIKTNAKK
jgi:hypothetical protein